MTRVRFTASWAWVALGALLATACEGKTSTPAQVEAPTFSPTGGTFNAPQDVTLASTTPGATIRYTTDGSSPSTSNGTEYAAPVHVAASMTIRAIAFKSGMDDSVVSSATYTILETVAAPSFSPVGGSYSAVQDVTLSSTTPSATIRYTVDGTDPSSTNGTTYSTPIHVAATTTIKAYATKAGFLDSTVESATYTIDLTRAAWPEFTPAAGTYHAAQEVTLASSTPGAEIRYTMTSDGTEPADPTAASPLFGTAITLALPASGTTTYRIKAIASASGFNDSVVSAATYTLTPQAAAPTFSPVAGTYPANRNVAITSATAGASVYYTMTTDGSEPADPTAASSQATAPIFVAAPETGTTTYRFKAFAAATGHADSAITSATFTLQPNPNGYELLTAGDFESNPGIDIWGFNKSNTVTTSIEDCSADGFTGKCLKMAGSGYGTNPWETQLFQNATPSDLKFFSIKSGKKYTFSMKARASAARSVQVLLQNAANTEFVGQTFNLTTSVATYTWEFYGEGKQLAFKIDFGGTPDGTTFELDDLSLLETDSYGYALQVSGTSSDNTYGSIGVGLKFDFTGAAVDMTGGTYTASFDLYVPSATPPNKLQFHFQNASYATVGVDIDVTKIPRDVWTRLTFPVKQPPLWAAPLSNASIFNIFYGAAVGTNVTFYLRNVKVTDGTNTPVDWPMTQGTDPSSLYAWVGTGVTKTIVQK